MQGVTQVFYSVIHRCREWQWYFAQWCRVTQVLYSVVQRVTQVFYSVVQSDPGILHSGAESDPGILLSGAEWPRYFTQWYRVTQVFYSVVQRVTQVFYSVVQWPRYFTQWYRVTQVFYSVVQRVTHVFYSVVQSDPGVLLSGAEWPRYFHCTICLSEPDWWCQWWKTLDRRDQRQSHHAHEYSYTPVGWLSVQVDMIFALIHMSQVWICVVSSVPPASHWACQKQSHLTWLAKLWTKFFFMLVLCMSIVDLYHFTILVALTLVQSKRSNGSRIFRVDFLFYLLTRQKEIWYGDKGKTGPHGGRTLLFENRQVKKSLFRNFTLSPSPI